MTNIGANPVVRNLEQQVFDRCMAKGSATKEELVAMGEKATDFIRECPLTNMKSFYEKNGFSADAIKANFYIPNKTK